MSANSSRSSNGSKVSLALGRIFALLLRPPRPGDIEEYERCRAIVLAELAPGHAPLPAPYRPDFCRDLRGRMWEGT